MIRFETIGQYETEAISSLRDLSKVALAGICMMYLHIGQGQLDSTILLMALCILSIYCIIGCTTCP